MTASPNQRSWLGVLSLVLCPVPVLGMLVGIVVQRCCFEGTSAHTCAMIATVFGGAATAIFLMRAIVLSLLNITMSGPGGAGPN